MTRDRVAWLCLAALLLPAGVQAQEPGTPEQVAARAGGDEIRPGGTEPAATARATAAGRAWETEQPRERLGWLEEPSLAAPQRQDSAATRGPDACARRILAMVPERQAPESASPSPTLLWGLEDDTDCRIDFVLNDPRQVKPVLERTLPGPHRAGVHRVSLEAFGVSLEPDVAYDWFVAIVPDPEARSHDVFAGGRLVHRPGATDAWYDRASRLGAAADAGAPGAAGSLASLLAAEGIALAGPGTASSVPDVAAGPTSAAGPAGAPLAGQADRSR